MVDLHTTPFTALVVIWVTADHRHIPVKLKSKVAVGSFVAELEN